MATINYERLQGKLNILADAAKYDVSCSSSAGTRKNQGGGLGDASATGICHSYTEDGRCVSLPAFIAKMSDVISVFGKVILPTLISRSARIHVYISSICRSAIGNISVKNKCYQMHSISKNSANNLIVIIYIGCSY